MDHQQRRLEGQKLLARGMSVKEVAAVFKITEKTARRWLEGCTLEQLAERQAAMPNDPEVSEASEALKGSPAVKKLIFIQVSRHLLKDHTPANESPLPQVWLYTPYSTHALRIICENLEAGLVSPVDIKTEPQMYVRTKPISMSQVLGLIYEQVDFDAYCQLMSLLNDMVKEVSNGGSPPEFDLNWRTVLLDCMQRRLASS